MSLSRIPFLFPQSFQFCSFQTESNGFAKVDYHPLHVKCIFTGEVHRADKKTKGRETANKNIYTKHEKLFPELFSPNMSTQQQHRNDNLLMRPLCLLRA